jgi:DNA-binding transcriptional LysR family regulator
MDGVGIAEWSRATSSKLWRRDSLYNPCCVQQGKATKLRHFYKYLQPKHTGYEFYLSAAKESTTKNSPNPFWYYVLINGQVAMRNEKLPRLNSRIVLNQLRYIVTAAEYGSFRRAAEILNIRQSTLSRSVRQLEDATSVMIFNRSRRGIAPSSSGSKIIRIAQNVLEQIDSLSSRSYAITADPAVKLCIGFCTSLSTGSLRAAVVELRNTYPSMQIRTLERSRSRLATALENGTVDVIISTGQLPTSKCKSQKLWSERVLIALPEDHHMASRETIYWTDLANETLLMSQYDPYWEFEDLVTSKILSQEERPKIEHHDVSRSILKSLISMKLGIGLLLESDIGAKIPGIIYRELQDGSGAARVGFCAFWDSSNENPALTSFIKLLAERYPSLS